VWTQLAIAIALVTNHHVKPALWAGIALNLCFTMAGRVNPSAFYLVMQMTLLFSLSRPVGVTIALRRATVWLIPAALFIPFAGTIDPAHVIDDPALMLSFVSLLAGVTTLAVAAEPHQLGALATSTPIGRWIASRVRTTPLRPR
jgi:hypothetical protein